MIHEFNSVTIDAPRTLVQALIFLGAYDCTVVVKEDYACIHTITTDYATALSAVNLSLSGSLLSNKTIRITEAQDNTDMLEDEGVSFLRPSDGATISSLEVSRDYAVFLHSFKEAIAGGEVPLPSTLKTLNGRSTSIASIPDAEAAYQAVVDRLNYLNGNITNGDSSLGEEAITRAIISAIDQTALDAIIDTRS